MAVAGVIVAAAAGGLGWFRGRRCGCCPGCAAAAGSFGAALVGWSGLGHSRSPALETHTL